MRPKTSTSWDRLSKSECERMQMQRLRWFLRHRILPFSPFYRRTVAQTGFDPASLKTKDDLRRLPFTTKADIVPSEQNPDGPRAFILQPTPELIRAALPKADLLAVLLKKLVRGEEGLRAELLREFNPVSLLFTTGRSAASLPFFSSLFDLEILRETGRRITQVLGLHPSRDKVVSLFPYAPHLAFWQVAECAHAGGILTLNTGGGRVMGGDRILGLIEKLKPTVVCGMPGYFYHILRRARDEGRSLPSIEKVALGGEAVSAALKEKIASTLREMGAKDPKVASVYGFTEARQCWSECCEAENTGFHLSADLSLMEIIDPETLEPVGEGQTGELVYTTLEGRGSVMLRYRTGDVIEGGMTYEPCPGCGRKLPRISSRIRRVSNVKTLELSKIKGTLVNFNSLAELLNGHREIEEWQVVISKANDDPMDVDELTLHCALAAGHDEVEFRHRIQREMVEQTEMHFNDVIVSSLAELLERVGMDVNMKEERIVDRRPRLDAAKEGAGRVGS